MDRRALLKGFGAICAPVIVPATSLMSLRGFVLERPFTGIISVVAGFNLAGVEAWARATVPAHGKTGEMHHLFRMLDGTSAQAGAAMDCFLRLRYPLAEIPPITRWSVRA